MILAEDDVSLSILKSWGLNQVLMFDLKLHEKGPKVWLFVIENTCSAIGMLSSVYSPKWYLLCKMYLHT